MKKIIFIAVIVAALGFQASLNAQMPGSMMNDSTGWRGMHQGMVHGMYPGMMGTNTQMRNNMKWNMNNRGHDGMGFHHMMMQDFPIAGCFAIIKHLPEMQAELSLTDDQLIKLIDLQTGYNKQSADLKADLQKEKIKLNSLVKNNAATKDVSDVLKSCSATMANLCTLAYDSANKMKAVLTDAQNQKLNEWLANSHDHDGHMGQWMNDN